MRQRAVRGACIGRLRVDGGEDRLAELARLVQLLGRAFRGEQQREVHADEPEGGPVVGPVVADEGEPRAQRLDGPIEPEEVTLNGAHQGERAHLHAAIAGLVRAPAGPRSPRASRPTDPARGRP